jgi:putative transcriptional regulator
MTPKHHVPDAELLEYAAGTTNAPAALAVACHVALCPACAGGVATLEAVGGSLLEASAGQALPAGALAATLARLDPPLPRAQALAAAQAPPPPAFLAPFALPAPLLRRLADTPGVRRWRFIAPGVRGVALSAPAADTTVRLVAFAPGITIPFHDHGGPEHVVVFSGALEEEDARFERGDISIRASGERHEQHVAAGEPCIALVVNEGKLQPLTLRGRILAALARG